MIKSLRFYTFQSFIGHLLIMALFSVLGFVVINKNLKMRKESLRLVSASVRVDVVALPDKTLKELKSLDQLQKDVQPEPVKEVIKKNNIREEKLVIKKSKALPKTNSVKVTKKDFKKKVKKRSLSDMLKKYSGKKVQATKRKTKIVKKEESLARSDLEKLKGLVNKGNKVRQGVALTGEVSEEILGVFDRYVVKLPELLKPFWKLPTYLQDQGLRCRIRVFINSQGKITRKSIVESSGEDDFDTRAMGSLDKIRSFPKPEQSIQKMLASGEVILGYPL